MKQSEMRFLATLAARQGVSLAEFVQATQEAIDAAWNTLDPEAAAFQRKLFPEGKPSPALFIIRLAQYADSNMSDNGMTV